MNQNEILARINELILKYVHDNKKFGLDSVDAIVTLCEEYNLDILDVADLIDENIKEMLKKDFINRHFLKEKIKSLPEELFKNLK